MYPAYLLVYSAPLDIRGKRSAPLPRMNRCAELLQRRSITVPSPRPSPRVPNSRDLADSSLDVTICTAQGAPPLAMEAVPSQPWQAAASSALDIPEDGIESCIVQAAADVSSGGVAPQIS